MIIPARHAGAVKSNGRGGESNAVHTTRYCTCQLHLSYAFMSVCRTTNLWLIFNSLLKHLVQECRITLQQGITK